MNFILSTFTILYLNVFLLIIILYLIHLFFKKIKFYWFLILINCKLIHNYLLILPLSNTLFLIHPIILYSCIIYTIYVYIKLCQINWLCLLFILLSLVLGGYWSIHEFNWGGWWNWDLLELFILLLICWNIFIFHQHNTIYNLMYFIYYWFINLLIYSLFNKIGLVTSIHSFVKSFFFKTYYYIYIIIFFYIILTKINFYFKPTLIAIILIYIYLNTLILTYFKYLLLFSIYYYVCFLKKFFKKIKLKLLHNSILFKIFIIIFFNYFNFPLISINFFSKLFELISINLYYNTWHIFNYWTQIIILYNKNIFFKPFNILFDVIWLFLTITSFNTYYYILYFYKF